MFADIKLDHQTVGNIKGASCSLDKTNVIFTLKILSFISHLINVMGWFGLWHVMLYFNPTLFKEIEMKPRERMRREHCKGKSPNKVQVEILLQTLTSYGLWLSGVDWSARSRWRVLFLSCFMTRNISVKGRTNSGLALHQSFYIIIFHWYSESLDWRHLLNLPTWSVRVSSFWMRGNNFGKKQKLIRKSARNFCIYMCL